MPASTFELSSINVHLPGANGVMNDITVGLSTSPSSLDVDHEQLTRIVRYTYEDKSIAFEIVNKPVTLAEPDPIIAEAGPASRNIFGNIFKAIFCSRVSRKTRRVKVNNFNATRIV